MAPPRFVFPAETLRFLTDLRAHMDKAWFDANRGRYEAGYVEPAKAFVEAIAPAVDEIVLGIATEPRVNGSIFRINRDTRFSKDKTPYKDHLDLWFWVGDRKTATSGLFLRIAPDAVTVGAGAHGFDRDRLARYRDAVITPDAGPDLLAVVAALDRAGHDVGGETYSRRRGATRAPPTRSGCSDKARSMPTPSFPPTLLSTRGWSRRCSAIGAPSHPSIAGSRPTCTSTRRLDTPIQL